MKKKFIHSLSILSVFFVSFLMFSNNILAMISNKLYITSYDYSVGDEISRSYNVNEVEIGKTLQLYAIIDAYDESLNPCRVCKKDLDGITWTSSNTSVAIVSENGLVTGLKEGQAVIKAKYEGNDDEYNNLLYSEDSKSDSYTVTVKKADASTGARITFADQFATPRPIYVVGEQAYCFAVDIIEIPTEERENIEYSIDDTNKAQIIDDDSCSEYGVAVKFLSPGKTKISASLKVNGQSYSDSYEFTILKDTSELYTLNVTGSKSKIYVGEAFQLNVVMTYGTTAPEDVTSDSKTVYSSSDEKVVKVSKNGLVTGVSVGKAVITVKYNDLVSKTYEITVVKSNSGETSNPKTGNNSAIIIGLIFIASLIGMFAYANLRYNTNN